MYMYIPVEEKVLEYSWKAPNQIIANSVANLINEKIVQNENGYIPGYALERGETASIRAIADANTNSIEISEKNTSSPVFVIRSARVSYDEVILSYSFTSYGLGLKNSHIQMAPRYIGNPAAESMHMINTVDFDVITFDIIQGSARQHDYHVYMGPLLVQATLRNKNLMNNINAGMQTLYFRKNGESRCIGNIIDVKETLGTVSEIVFTVNLYNQEDLNPEDFELKVLYNKIVESNCVVLETPKYVVTDVIACEREDKQSADPS